MIDSRFTATTRLSSRRTVLVMLAVLTFICS